MSALSDRSFGNERTPCQAIVRAIADREGIDVTDLEPPAYDPLYAVVDPEALDDLFRTRSDDGSVNASVQFEYAGYDVLVHADGRVEIAEGSTAPGTTEPVERPAGD